MVSPVLSLDFDFTLYGLFSKDLRSSFFSISIIVIYSPQFYSLFHENGIIRLNDNLSLSLWKTDKSALVVAAVSQTDGSFCFVVGRVLRPTV